MPKYYTIDEDAARRAKEAMSFDSYQEGFATAEYRRMVDKAAGIADRQKQSVDPMYHEKIDSLLDSYSRKLAENLNAGYRIDASCPSIMISGASNFPVRKKEKQNSRRDSNMAEFNEIQGILDRIRGVGRGGISSDDPNALQKLEKNLESHVLLQEQMKAVNAYYRKHKNLDGCPDLTAEQIEAMTLSLKQSWRPNPLPFESYALSNNNATIRRLRERIATLKKLDENAPTEGWEFDGGKVVVNSDVNRVQIFFDEKPGDDLRSALKQNGFRWAPSQGAWQRQYTQNAIRAARSIKELCPAV